MIESSSRRTARSPVSPSKTSCASFWRSRVRIRMKPFSTISLQMPLTDPIQGLVLDIEIDTKQTIRMGYFGFQKLKNSFIIQFGWTHKWKDWELVGWRVADPGWLNWSELIINARTYSGESYKSRQKCKTSVEWQIQMPTTTDSDVWDVIRYRKEKVAEKAMMDVIPTSVTIKILLSVADLHR